MGNPTKDEMKAFYAKTAERCLDAYAQLDEKEWSKKASDHWSAREHLAYTVGTLEEEMLPVTRARCSGVRGACIGESIGPGLRQFTPMPVPSRSRATLRVNATTAPFDAV